MYGVEQQAASGAYVPEAAAFFSPPMATCRSVQTPACPRSKTKTLDLDMGVPKLWDEVKAQGGYLPRLPFALFAEQFRREHGRPVRIAVDGCMWTVEAARVYGSLVAGAVASLRSRVRVVMQAHVLVVVVFDGADKPAKRQGQVPVELAQAYLARTAAVRGDGYVLPVQREFVEVLRKMAVDHVVAAGEGEAECARLERAGVVDYVLTNDVDVLLFGARKVLRNFSRFAEDQPAGYSMAYARDVVADRAHYWVTPVEACLLSDEAMLALVLAGSDYGPGVLQLAARKAVQIAVTKTAGGRELYGELFGRMVRGTGGAEELERAHRGWFAVLNRRLAQDPVLFFGRKAVVDLLQPPPLVVSLYFGRPALRREVFLWVSGRVGHAEYSERWFDLRPEPEGGFAHVRERSRSRSASPQRGSPERLCLHPWLAYLAECYTTRGLFRRGAACIVGELDKPPRGHEEVARPYPQRYRVEYTPAALWNEPTPELAPFREWVFALMVESFAPWMVEEYRERQEEERRKRQTSPTRLRSPKRRAPLQTTTLDLLGAVRSVATRTHPAPTTAGAAAQRAPPRNALPTRQGVLPFAAARLPAPASPVRGRSRTPHAVLPSQSPDLSIEFILELLLPAGSHALNAVSVSSQDP